MPKEKILKEVEFDLNQDGSINWETKRKMEKKPSKNKKGKCVVCDKPTSNMEKFCDEPDGVGYLEYCHKKCYECAKEKL